MLPVELTEAADADLVEILSYGTAAFGEEQAEAYVASFDDTFELISWHPLAGAVHDEVQPPIQSLPHGSHRIFYDVFEEEVVVQRILHKAVDVLPVKNLYCHCSSRDGIEVKLDFFEQIGEEAAALLKSARCRGRKVPS